jgi:hypothetical protein
MKNGKCLVLHSASEWCILLERMEKPASVVGKLVVPSKDPNI